MGAEESHQIQQKLDENESIVPSHRRINRASQLHGERDYVTFFVNGRECIVSESDPDIGPTYVLVDYIREKLGLRGVKLCCFQGGCGTCLVTAKSIHPVTGEEVVGSVNSCLIPLYACDGMNITTIEALGNKRDGYSEIQNSLVKFGGTQCGFCTPGFVMNMNSLAVLKPNFTENDVEYSFDGNICRCTGYRPIIDAFRALSTDPSEELKRKCVDIEDISLCPMKTKDKKKGGPSEDESLEIVHIPRAIYLRGKSDKHWFKEVTLKSLFETIQRFVSARVTYRLVAGHTSIGVYRNDGPYRGYIEIGDIPELKHESINQDSIVFGGNVTLTAAINVFHGVIKTDGYVYARSLYKHFRRIASLSIRNRGTLAGNLMLKHMHREFPSDVFPLLEAVGAQLQIGTSLTMSENYTLTEFLELDMTGKVIMFIHLPTYGKDYVFRSFKLSRRYQNSHALVNAAFLFEFDEKSATVKSRPRIVYGGISSNFVHASQTEEYLEGKQLTTIVLQKALKLIEHEAVPEIIPTSGSPTFRAGLAQSFLYKFLLQIMGNVVIPRLRSGAYDVERSLNKGRQIYDTDQKKWPLNKPIPKIESYQQSSGEAEYIDDINSEINELHGAFVITTVGNATIKSIDASDALNTPGVVAFYTAKDIPGVNNYCPLLRYPEEVFVERSVKYAGQSVGLLVARSRQIALEARSLVKVQYENYQQPVINVAEAVKNLPKNSGLENFTALSFPCKGLNQKITREIIENIQRKSDTKEKSEQRCTGNNSLYKIKGQFQTRGQYHFHMEPQCCLALPRENSMELWTSTQCMEFVQVGVAGVLNVPANYLVVNVRRLGGGFGAKVSKASLIAAACSVAAYRTNQPVRVVLDLETNMQMIGKRLPYLANYEVEVDGSGKIHKLKNDIFCDGGSVANEPTSLFAMIASQSCYQATNWHITPGAVTTNTATNTYCRAPGSSAGVAIIETILEHIAHVVNRDPLYVREVNFIRKGDPLIGVPGARLVLDNPLAGMIANLKADCDYDSRKKYVAEFNKSNRWRKRGISIVPQRYPNAYGDFRLPTFISVYNSDGSVNVSHGGIEMGQGINTKVAQVVAYTLGIPLEKVSVQPSNSIITPNSGVSAASIASELVCSSARRACQQLLERLAPIRKILNNPTWEELIAAANAKEILLTSQFQEQQGDVHSYDIWGAACVEMEVDVLTGDFKIVRTDLMVDAGQSISPLVDVGQVEGAFVMGLGWWLTEELIYDNSTGALLTDNTWTYKPMLPADIPEDFRIYLMKNAPNPFGVLSSKATGEPPLNMSVAAIFALRQAIDSARQDAGDVSWYQMDGPVTREKVRELSLTSANHFTFK